MRRGLAVALGVAVCAIVFAAPAWAQGGTTSAETNDQIVLSGHLIVTESETVDTALIFHGPATIAGTVTGAVVVFDGDADISGTVRGDVVAFNGTVTVRSTASIDGDLITRERATVEPGATIQGDQRRVNGRFELHDLGLAGRIAWWIGFSVSTLILGLALLLLAPGLDGALTRSFRGRTGASFGFGAAAFFLLPIVAVALLAIVVAIPLGLFLLLGLALVYTVGYVAAAHVLGRLLVRSPTSRFLAFLAGWGILRVAALVPVLGGIVWTVATIAGLGVLWVAARRRPGAELDAPPQAPPPPPAPIGAGG